MRTANRKRLLDEKRENIRKQLKAMRPPAAAVRRDPATVFRKIAVVLNLNDLGQLAEVARMVSTPANPVTVEDVARKAVGFYLDAVATDLGKIEAANRELLERQRAERLAAEAEALIAPAESDEAYTRETSPADSQIAEGEPVEKTAA